MDMTTWMDLRDSSVNLLMSQWFAYDHEEKIVWWKTDSKLPGVWMLGKKGVDMATYEQCSRSLHCWMASVS